MIDLTAFQQHLLIAIAIRDRAGDETYGLGIKSDLTEWYREAGLLEDGDDVNHGRLYPNLDELVDRGLLEKSALDKRTNEYDLTTKGRSEVFDYKDLLDFALGNEDSNPFTATDRLIPADD